MARLVTVTLAVAAVAVGVTTASSQREQLAGGRPRSDVTPPASTPTTAAPDRSGNDTTGVDLPDIGQIGRAGTPPPERLGCEPEGCLVWWTDEIDHRPVHVLGDIAVHEGRDELVAVDVVTGAVRWRITHPVDRYGPRPPTEIYHLPTTYGVLLADEHGLVLHANRYSDTDPPRQRVPDSAEGATGEDDDLYGTARVPGSTLWFVDAQTGRTERRDYETLRVTSVTRASTGALLVYGYDGQARASSAHFATDDLTVTWTSRPEAPISARLSPDGSVLLLIDRDTVSALDVEDLHERWRRPLEGGGLLTVDDRVVIDGLAGGRLVILDLETGEPVAEHDFDADGAYASIVSPRSLVDWPNAAGVAISVHAGGRHHLLDPRDGAILTFRSLPPETDEPDLTSMWFRPAAVRTGLGLVVLWPATPATTLPELVVHPPDGTSLGEGIPVPLTIPIPAVPVFLRNGWEGIELFDLGDGTIRVVFARMHVVDVNLGELPNVAIHQVVTSEELTGVDLDDGTPRDAERAYWEAGTRLFARGSYIVVRDDTPRDGTTTTWLSGPHGRISLRGASQVASIDPLIVHGPAGAMRLDPAGASR